MKFNFFHLKKSTKKKIKHTLSTKMLSSNFKFIEVKETYVYFNGL